MSDVTTELAMEASDKAMEIARLKAENDRLREQSERLFDKTLELATENSKLRELCKLCEREAENAKLRELVLVLKNCADENGDCDACPINNAKPVRHPWFGCDALRDMMRDLGVEVEQ